MKFNEIDEKSWAELHPYFDTCLVPISGLTGEETPGEATDKVARTGQWLLPLEEAFRGRTVTMPAYHYYSVQEEDPYKFVQLCEKWKSSGFKYVIAVCGSPHTLISSPWVDLVIQPSTLEEQPDSELIVNAVTKLWRKSQ